MVMQHKNPEQPYIRLALWLFCLTLVSVTASAQGDNPTVLYLFWGEGCPHCKHEKQFLETLTDRFPALEVRSFEVFNHVENRQLFTDMATAFGSEARGVPTTILGDNLWIGFSETTASDIEHQVAYCLETQTCADPAQRLPDTVITRLAQHAPTTLKLPLFGTIHPDQSLILSTALIAFVDGFNPCSLWVLSMLLAIVLYTGSRAKIFAIGSTFLLVSATVYTLFIAGVFNALSFVSYLKWVQVAIGLLTLTFALINIKDYFFYKQGISLTIADSQKPALYKGFRKIMAADKSMPAMLGATAVMALGVTLLELPCTAGLPVIWSGLITQHHVGVTQFLVLLAVYMLVFLLDELLLFGSAVVTLKVSKLEETQGRVLKLSGGMVMLALALVMLLRPELMQSVSATLAVFAAALLVSVLILFLQWLYLPKAKPQPSKPAFNKTRR